MLSDDAAMCRLAADEEEFENSNMFRLPDGDLTNQDAISLQGETDSKNISQFFGNDLNDLGLEGTGSPEKMPFKKPVVPVAYGGASETFCLGKIDQSDDGRRDTVSTIKSMPYSIFETTQEPVKKRLNFLAIFKIFEHLEKKYLKSSKILENLQKIRKSQNKT